MLGSYFSLRVITTSAGFVAVTGSAGLPEAVGSTTGGATEALEGLRLALTGDVAEAPSALTDGLGVTLDDGTGAIRIVVGPDALAGRTISTGDRVTAVGPLGQRDSSGTGLAGYRLHATLPGEVTIEQPPDPTPTPSPEPTASPTPAPTGSPDPTASPTAAPSPTPTTSPSPTPSPTPSPSPTMEIAAARQRSVGTHVTVVGVLTAEPGRLGTPSLVAIQDATAGIVIRLPDGFRAPMRGTRLEVTGTLADPYGQLEIRAVSSIRTVGQAAVPAAIAVTGASLDDDVEGRIVSTDGTLEGRPTKATSGDITFVVETSSGTIRAVADASAAINAASFADGDRVRLTGIAGQRASRKGAPDGFRVWLRGATDVTRLAAAATPTPAPSGSGPNASPSPSGTITIAAAILRRSGVVTVEGTVTVPARLLDATGRRIVVQDRTAAIEVLVPVGAAAPSVGSRIRVTGGAGRAYDAPRIRSTTLVRLGSGSVAAVELRAAPSAAHEWRLVTIRGDLLDVRRSGERWTAELRVGGVRIPVAGLAGASIPYAAILEGHSATITGIVRRPHPSATDRRFAVQPRSSADVRVGARADDSSAGSTPLATGSAAPTGGMPPGGGGLGAPGAAIPDIDLTDLGRHVGQTVRVGGLVAATTADGFDLDDGTASATVILTGSALELLATLAVGDALSAIGRVEAGTDGAAAQLVVDDPGAVTLVGSLGGSDASGGPVAGSTAPSDGVVMTANETGTREAALGEPSVPPVSIVGIVLISLASLAVTLLRRHRLQRRFRARIAARLAAISRPTMEPAVASTTRTGGTMADEHG